MDSPRPTIRLAGEKDVPVILQLVRELASHVGYADSVEATEETLAATMQLYAGAPNNSQPNSVRPSSCLLVVNSEGAVAGFAAYYYTYSTWKAQPGIFLEDLFVRKHERHKGYGKMLLKELANKVIEVGGGRLEWDVLKWNTPSIQFYKSLGARQLDEWDKMRLEGKDIVRLAQGNV